VPIEKGQAWGAPGALGADGVIVRTDAEARAVIEAARGRGDAPPPLGLLGGDLAKTLGGPGDADRLRSPDAVTFTVDLGVVTFAGTDHVFLAHAIARRRWWRGRAVAVMNAQWLGDWDLGPRAHPGDGLLDVTDGALPWGDRLKARVRVRTGTHLPHPALHTSRVASLDLDLGRALDLWLDGDRVGRTAELHVRVEPDAVRVVV
jgi:YegS C-terminal NAD kinase beta sandwich-like domain